MNRQLHAQMRERMERMRERMSPTPPSMRPSLYVGPLYVVIHGCNVTLADSIPEDQREAAATAAALAAGRTQGDPFSPNPFLQSLYSIVDDFVSDGYGGEVHPCWWCWLLCPSGRCVWGP